MLLRPKITSACVVTLPCQSSCIGCRVNKGGGMRVFKAEHSGVKCVSRDTFICP